MNDFSALLKRHRSIRQFKPDAIAPELIEAVCGEAVTGGSTSGNLSSYSIILTRDPSRKHQLYALHQHQPMILQAPLVMTFCADWFRTRQWLKRRGARDNFNNFLSYHTAAFDAMILAQNVCLGFESRGLGICYMGTTLRAMPEIAALLELPETCVPVTSVVVGYPDEAPAVRERLPLRAFLHDETYHQPGDAELDEIFADREQQGWTRLMANAELKAAIDAAGISSLATYYTSRLKYDPESSVQASAKLIDTLKAAGFLQAQAARANGPMHKK